MKKFFALVLFALLSLEVIYAKTVAVFLPELKGAPETDSTWIPNIVVSNLETRFKTYTDFDVINNVAEKLAASEIKNSELYDSDIILEAGKWLSAQYLCTSEISATLSGYSVSVKVTETETGLLKGSVVKNFISTDFADKEAWNALAYDLFVNSMKLEISEGQMALLQNSDSESSSDLEKMADEILSEIKKLSVENDEYKKEIAEGNKADILQEKVKANELLLKRKVEEEKNLRRRADMLKADEERAAKEASRRASLDESEQKRIEKMRQELAKQKSNQEQQKLKNLHPEKQVALLEQQKSVLDKQINETIASVEKQLELDQAVHEEKIVKYEEDFHNKKLYPSFFTDGKFNEVGKNNLALTIKNEEKNLEEQKIKDASKILDAAKVEEKKLIQIIEKGQNTLASKTYVEKTLTGSKNLVVRFEEYDGELGVWPMEMKFYFHDTLIWERSWSVTYKDITGKKPVAYNPSNPRNEKFLDFQNDINAYNSLFLQAEPVVAVEVNYTVQTVDQEYPSTRIRNGKKEIVFPETDSSYLITIEDFTVYSFKNDKAKKICNVKDGDLTVVSCAEESSYHVWTSASYWNLLTGNQESAAEQKKIEKALKANKTTSPESIAANKIKAREKALAKANEEVARKEKIIEQREQDAEIFAKERERQSEEEKAAKRAADKKYRKELHAPDGFDINFGLLGGQYGNGSVEGIQFNLPLSDYTYWSLGLQHGKINGVDLLNVMGDVGFNFYVNNKLSPYAHVGVGCGVFAAKNGYDNEVSGLLNMYSFSPLDVTARAGIGLYYIPLKYLKIHGEYSIYYMTGRVGFVEGATIGITLGRF